MSVTVEQKPWGRILIDDETGQQVGSIIENRRLYVLDPDFSLTPTSMLGSVFLVFVDRQPMWKGVVVAEPAGGKYLVELDKLEDGAEAVQRLFTLDTLLGLGDEGRRILDGGYADARAPVIDPVIEWRFYDDDGKAQAAYIAWTRAQNVTEQEPA